MSSAKGGPPFANSGARQWTAGGASRRRPARESNPKGQCEVYGTTTPAKQPARPLDDQVDETSPGAVGRQLGNERESERWTGDEETARWPCFFFSPPDCIPPHPALDVVGQKQTRPLGFAMAYRRQFKSELFFYVPFANRTRIAIPSFPGCIVPTVVELSVVSFSGHCGRAQMSIFRRSNLSAEAETRLQLSETCRRSRIPAAHLTFRFIRGRHPSVVLHRHSFPTVHTFPPEVVFCLLVACLPDRRCTLDPVSLLSERQHGGGARRDERSQRRIPMQLKVQHKISMGAVWNSGHTVPWTVAFSCCVSPRFCGVRSELSPSGTVPLPCTAT